MGNAQKTFSGMILAGVITGGLVAPAQAQDNLYLGIDLHAWSVSPQRGDNWRDLGVRGRVGGRLNEHIAVEAHLASGGSDRSNSVTLELDYLAALFLRGDLPLTRYTSLYGLVGLSQVKLTAGGSSDTDSSISFGAGADYRVTDNTYVNLDLIRYVDETDFNYSALSLGARWTF